MTERPHIRVRNLLTAMQRRMDGGDPSLIRHKNLILGCLDWYTEFFISYKYNS
jgi:hypothetical protein